MSLIYLIGLAMFTHNALRSWARGDLLMMLFWAVLFVGQVGFMFKYEARRLTS